MTRILLVFVCTICFFSLFLTVNAVAQEEQEESEQSLLPEIDPQDIEIRSQFQARFPGLRRQPILGFNPRPRVYQIDPNRLPFVEDEETVVASLPIGVLERPAPPVYRALGYADPKNGFARIGIGSYMTPEADLYAIANVGEKNWLSGNVNFLSSDGHLDDFTSSYRDLTANINSYNALSDRTKLSLTAGVESSFNHYPGLIRDGFDPVQINSRMEKTGFSGGMNLNVAQTSLTGLDLSLSGYGSQFDFTSDVPGAAGQAAEWGMNGNVELSRLGSNIEEVQRIRLNVDAGGADPVGGTLQNWSVSTLSGHYERLFNYQTEIKASLGVAGVSDAINDFTFYLVPDLSITHTLFHGLDILGRISAKPGHPSYGSLQKENRFLDLATPLQHQYKMTALGEIHIEPFSGTKLTGGISYQNIKNYLYYARNDVSVDVPEEGLFDLMQGYYQPRFEDAEIFKVYGSFTQDLKPEVVWITAGGYWQVPRLSGNEKIPFVEPLGLNASVSIRPTRQVLLEAWGEFAGNRETSAGEELSSFVLIGSRFEISLTRQIGLYGKILNLFDEEYERWHGYTERGFQGYVGITFLF